MRCFARAWRANTCPEVCLLAYDGALWVADAQSSRLVRVQPGSGRLTARVPVGNTPLRIVAFRGSIWSTDFGAGTVSRVSPATLRRVATVRVGPQPEGIVAFGPDLWVVSQQGGYLARIAPPGARLANRIPVGNQPRQVAAGGAYLWVSVFGNDSVTSTGSTLRVTSDSGPSTAVLDPRTGTLAHRVKLSDAFIGDANSDVTVAGNDIWVSSPDEGTVYEVPQN